MKKKTNTKEVVSGSFSAHPEQYPFEPFNSIDMMVDTNNKFA